MTRIFCGLLLVVLLGASSRPCAATDKANSAYSALSGLQAPLWVAKEAGFFKKHDIDAQVLFIVGGRVISLAMFAGELQMGLSSMAALLQASTCLRAMSRGFNQVLDYSNELLFPLASLTTTRAYIRQSSAVAKFKAESFYDSAFVDELRKKGY